MNNRQITLAYVCKLIREIPAGGDNGCRLELHLLAQELTGDFDSASPFFELGYLTENSNLIKLLTEAHIRLQANNRLDLKVKADLMRRLKALCVYLDNEKEYQKLGIKYEDILCHDTSSNTSKKYFDRAVPQYLDPEKITEESVNSLSIVFVSGISPNPYAHTLLKIGDLGYLHIYDLYSKPLFIPKNEFGDFLRESGQILLGIQELHVPHMEGARKELKKSLQTEWLWGMYVRNCVSFIHKIADAGGVSRAQLDRAHIGDYHGRVMYPTALYDAIPLDELKLSGSLVDEPKLNDSLDASKERKKEIPSKQHKKKIHSDYKDQFYREFLGDDYKEKYQKFLGNKPIPPSEKFQQAKEYVRYRLKGGLSEKEATFLLRYKVVLDRICEWYPIVLGLFKPCILALNLPIIVPSHLKTFSVFSKKKDQSTPATETPSVSSPSQQS